jgi:hypothetical protein
MHCVRALPTQARLRIFPCTSRHALALLSATALPCWLNFELDLRSPLSKRHRQGCSQNSPGDSSPAISACTHRIVAAVESRATLDLLVASIRFSNHAQMHRLADFQTPANPTSFANAISLAASLFQPCLRILLRRYPSVKSNFLRAPREQTTPMFNQAKVGWKSSGLIRGRCII